MANEYWNKERKGKAIDDVFERIAEGESLRSILNIDRDKKALPSRKTFNEWLCDDERVSDQYVRACEDRTDKRFDSIEKDYLETPLTDPSTGKIDSGWVQLQRLKIDSKKWELSKMNPKKYSDKNTTILEGGDKPVSINHLNLGAGKEPDETTT